MHNLIRTFSQPITLLLILSSVACSSGNDFTDESSSANDSNGDLMTIAGVVSQDNFIVLAADLQPEIFADPGSNTHTYTEVYITVKLGDNRNQRLTDSHKIYFRTEWGLITPSCMTEYGECTVTWSTSSAEQAPADHKNTILAYTIGEESFDDSNGNFIFDDNDTAFRDIEEPYVDSNRNGIHDPGEPIVDVANGNDPTGVNGVHDIADGFLNSANCTHSSLCSTRTSTYVWNDVELDMDGPPTAP
jgi:hypothetical protein